MEPKKTSFPLLFVTADIDPVTPKKGYMFESFYAWARHADHNSSAYQMSSVFPGSVVLEQNTMGVSYEGDLI